MGIFEESSKELKTFRNSVKIQSSKLIPITKDLDEILRKSNMGSAVAFKLSGNKLEIRCMNVCYYEAHILLEEDYEECEIVTIYKPMSKMIPSNCELDVVLTPVGVEIKSPISEILILNNIATVPRVEVANYGFTSFDYAKVRNGIKELLSTTSIINSIGTGVNIVMLGKYMHCKYATVYIECPSSGLHNSITREIGKILLNFLYGDENCFMAETPNNQIFKKGNRYLVLPLNKIKENSIMELVEKGEEFGYIHVSGLHDKLKAIVQSYGNGVGTIDFYKDRITVNRQDESCKIKTMIGSGKEYYFSIDINLEYMRDIASVLGDSFKLYKRGDNACLTSLDGHVSIL